MYAEKGVDGLADGGGRTKSIEEMTANEKLRAENRVLRAKNLDLDKSIGSKSFAFMPWLPISPGSPPA